MNQGVGVVGEDIVVHRNHFTGLWAVPGYGRYTAVYAGSLAKENFIYLNSTDPAQSDFEHDIFSTVNAKGNFVGPSGTIRPVWWTIPEGNIFVNPITAVSGNLNVSVSSLGAYMRSLGYPIQQQTELGFYAELSKQQRKNWRPEFGIDALIKFFAGYRK